LVGVKHWVRNLERLQEFAFWLPTATDYFYPDFVAELSGGQLLVVEYKGDAYVTNDDSREKRLVGERWAHTTGQRFAMVEKMRDGKTMLGQLQAAIA
jgi:type III restriction enzyme